MCLTDPISPRCFVAVYDNSPKVGFSHIYTIQSLTRPFLIPSCLSNSKPQHLKTETSSKDSLGSSQAALSSYSSKSQHLLCKRLVVAWLTL
jgi:hypothetical protein